MDEWELASECSEGYNNGYNSDCNCNSGDREEEVAATTIREWDRQHGWLHSPERAADRSEAEQELAKVVAALRAWHAAAAAAT